MDTFSFLHLHYITEKMICQASDKLILNDIGNLVKRSLHLHSADIVSLHRHAVNYAGRLVLPYRERSGLPHFKQTVRAVPTHSGEDNADGVCFGGISDA